MKADPVSVLYILAVNLAGLALTIWGIVRSGDRAQVLVYAFILDYCLRLATIYLITVAGFPRALIPLVSSPPPAGQQSYPIRVEGSDKPVGPAGYVVVVLVFGFFAFMLVNVNAEKELELDAATSTSATTRAR